MKKLSVLAVVCSLSPTVALAVDCQKLEGTVKTHSLIEPAADGSYVQKQLGTMDFSLSDQYEMTSYNAEIQGEVVGQRGPVVILNHVISWGDQDSEQHAVIKTEGDIAAGFPDPGGRYINVEEKINFASGEYDMEDMLPNYSSAVAAGKIDTCFECDDYQGNRFRVSGHLCFETVSPAAR